MNAHPLEETLPGKLLLLTAKIVMPLLVLALLVVTPTFVPRRLLYGSFLLDLVLRLLSALVLLRAFWLLPDLAQRYNPQASGWSTRLWANAGRRGRDFLTFYVIYAGLITLLVSAVSAWALNVFLPSTGFAPWLLSALFGLQFAVLYILQYPSMRQKVTGLKPINGQAAPPRNGNGGSGNGHGNGSGPIRPPAAGPARPTTVPPRTLRGVVIPRRKPDHPEK